MPPPVDDPLGALDNAVWRALAASPAHRVDRVEGAARYRHDVAPFYAVDALDDRGWSALAELAGRDGA